MVLVGVGNNFGVIMLKKILTFMITAIAMNSNSYALYNSPFVIEYKPIHCQLSEGSSFQTAFTFNIILSGKVGLPNYRDVMLSGREDQSFLQSKLVSILRIEDFLARGTPNNFLTAINSPQFIVGSEVNHVPDVVTVVNQLDKTKTLLNIITGPSGGPESLIFESNISMYRIDQSSAKIGMELTYFIEDNRQIQNDLSFLSYMEKFNGKKIIILNGVCHL